MFEQQEHEAAYRQLLIQGALAILLPTEDLENACLRTLVADVIADSFLGHSIGGKVCEGWFVWSTLTKLIEVVKAKIEPKATGAEIEVDTRSRLEKFGLLADRRKEDEQTTQNYPLKRSAFASSFWPVLQYCYLTIISVRFVIVGLMTAYSQPPRSPSVSKMSKAAEPLPIDKPINSLQSYRPILDFRIFPLISAILDLASRMPWLFGSMALLQHQLMYGPLTIGATNGILDQ